MPWAVFVGFVETVPVRPNGLRIISERSESDSSACSLSNYQCVRCLSLAVCSNTVLPRSPHIMAY